MKKLNTFLLMCFTFSSFILYAQAPVIQWNKEFGALANTDARCVQQTKDGGYIVGGGQSGDDSQGTLVVKYDKNGNQKWQRSYGGGPAELIYSIEQTSDGGYVLAEAKLYNQPGGEQTVVKLDGRGNIKWQTPVVISANDFAYSVQQTSDGGYIVGGGTFSGKHSRNGKNEDVWVAKLDTSGNIVWQNSYGGSGTDVVNSIRQTSDGGYIAAGNTTSNNGEVTGVHDTISGDYWIIRLNNKGKLLWQKTLGGTDYDAANAVIQTSDGGYYAAGVSHSSNGNVTGTHGGADYWVVKLNANARLIWEKTYGDSSDDGAYATQQTADGGYVIGGLSQNFVVIKTDSAGNLQWQAPNSGIINEGGYEAMGLDQASDGGYITAGFSRVVKLSNACATLSNKDTPASSLKIQEPAISNLTISPNPAHNSIYIQFASKEANTFLEVINETGQTIIQKQIASFNGGNTMQLDVSQLASGIYMLLVKTKSGVQSTQFIKE